MLLFVVLVISSEPNTIHLKQNPKNDHVQGGGGGGALMTQAGNKSIPFPSKTRL
jgi:hypothetical protein